MGYGVCGKYRWSCHTRYHTSKCISNCWASAFVSGTFSTATGRCRLLNVFPAFSRLTLASIFKEALSARRSCQTRLMLLAAIPAADVLRAALFKRKQKEALRILIVLLCLVACRQGRAAIRYSACKLASPVSFLLWCLRSKRRRDGNNLLHAQTRRQRRGWRGELAKANLIPGDATTSAGEEKAGAEAGAAMLLAALGEAGRLGAFDKLRELQQEGACCDVTLVVGDRHFKAHKCVLAAHSFPLRAMFEGAFKEGSESVIALRGVEPSSFGLLLDFFYDRTVNITADNVEALLDLSARYSVLLLRLHCCSFVARSANPRNSCSLFAMADRYDCHRLRKGLLAYILECFPLACCNGGADGFSQLPMALVAEVLKDDRLVPGNAGEVTVFWAAISWLEVDKSRRRCADQVLSHVRFGLISAKTLAVAVEAHPLVQSEVGKAFVHEAYRYQALPRESRDGFAESMEARAQPRTGGSDGYPVGALGQTADSDGLDQRLGQLPLGEDARSNRDEDGKWKEGEDHSELEWMMKINRASCGADGDGYEDSCDGSGSGSYDADTPVDSPCEQDGSGVAQIAPSSCGVKEDDEEAELMSAEGEGDEKRLGGGVTGCSRIAQATAKPARRSWGAGLRMYV